MAHVEEQVRAAFVALVTGLATTGSNVFESEVHPLTPDTMPGLCIYVAQDRNIGGTFDATSREVVIAVDAYVEGTEYDSVHAEIMKEIEVALYGSEQNGRFFNGMVMNLVYDGHSSSFVESAAVRHGVRKMRWKCEYQTEDGNAEVAT